MEACRAPALKGLRFERFSEHLLFAKDNPRLGQIVGRKFYFDLIARHDPNEMLPHFPRDMGQDIARPRQVDTEHRPRQYLRHRPFGHDLLFFRHARIIGREPGVLNSAALTPARDPDPARAYSCKRGAAHGRTTTAVPIRAAS